MVYKFAEFYVVFIAKQMAQVLEENKFNCNDAWSENKENAIMANSAKIVHPYIM